MYKNTPVHYIAKYAVDVMLYLGIICTLTVPFIAKKFIAPYYGYSREELISFCIMLMISGACAVYIMYNLKRMFKTLLGGSPFVAENVTSLRKIALSCAVIALIFLAKCFFLFSFSTLLIFTVFVIGTLFSLTLKDIFKQAIFIKEENDLTV